MARERVATGALAVTERTGAEGFVTDELVEWLRYARASGLLADGIPTSWIGRTESEELPSETGLDPTQKPQLGSDPDWPELEAAALGCTKCRLSETRNRVVFGVGRRESPLIAFVGEGPGADEDRIGEPFVGRAGALLTAAITKGLGLQRSDVYIANVVKCRPPGNRAPLPDEVAACTPYLYRQLELLQPKVIVTLGQPAQLALSGVEMGITKLRGRWLEWRGIRLMPTFHPAYILRNPAVKRDFWADLQEVMRVLGLPPVGKAGAGEVPLEAERVHDGTDEENA